MSQFTCHGLYVCRISFNAILHVFFMYLFIFLQCIGSAYSLIKIIQFPKNSSVSLEQNVFSLQHLHML